MSTFRKKLFRLSTVKINLGCGSCRKQKLSDIYNPNEKSKYPTYHKHKNYYTHPVSSSSGEKDDSVTTPSATATPTTASTTPFSPCPDDSFQFSEKRNAYMNTVSAAAVGDFGRIGDESVAVEKDSDDPYLDFRQSMLQMILENQIYSKEDLKQLLHCFLQLNSPYHHGIIIRAFTEIWNGVYSNKLYLGRRSRDHF